MKISQNYSAFLYENRPRANNISNNINKEEGNKRLEEALNTLSFLGKSQITFKGPDDFKLLTDEEFTEAKKEYYEKIKDIPFFLQLCADKLEINKYNLPIVNKILSNKNFYIENKIIFLDRVLRSKSIETTQAKCAIIDKICSEDKLYNNRNFIHKSYYIIGDTQTIKDMELKSKAIDKICSDEKLYQNPNIMFSANELISVIKTPKQLALTEKILSDENIYNNEEFINYAWRLVAFANTPAKIDFAYKILSDEKFYGNFDIINKLHKIIDNIRNKEEAKAKGIILDKIFKDNIKELEKYAGEIIDKVKSVKQAQIKCRMIDKILSDEKLCNNENIRDNIAYFVSKTDSEEELQSRTEIIDKILSNKEFIDNEEIKKKLGQIVNNINCQEHVNELIKNLYDEDLSAKQALMLFFEEADEITYDKLKEINAKMGLEKTSKFCKFDTIIACKFINLYNKKNINEIPLETRHELLRNLIDVNSYLFNISDEIKKYFPILPKNKEEYCSLLPEIVKSIGIETNPLTENQIKEFNNNISSLSKSLAKLTDEEFNNLKITQEYDKNTFINDVLKIVKNSDISTDEKQKVYDYFGFEIHKNDEADTGYSIKGYPVNLNNGKKLAQIQNEQTKDIIEKLRPYIIKFSENNPVICSNKKIEAELNKIVDVMPELRPQIGKLQAGNTKEDGTKIRKGVHDFDVFKHSLKVMQKLAQNTKYKKLDESDKKIMLLAALLHDITKKEGYPDPTHATEGSFDAYFISKKFNLTKNEEIKLYDLIKHHEWLGTIYSGKYERSLWKFLQDTAYDLRYDNVFDMSLLFTHADLKAVKRDDSFHDKKDIRGISRGINAELYAYDIKNFIEQLKPSQPILPVTPFPKASTINKAITTVNEDGSTNIKGIYKDKDGLIIIKFNELENEDLEKIGFPKGSVVKGIKTKTSAGEEVNTGNIKFFAHGLENEYQLTKFDAFALPDSDALLSVSYAERPESKYRFFRTQGILLDCDTKYIHGGGETDAGSGNGKSIQDFKDFYIFNGNRVQDRNYISDLIKEATGMNDNEYVKFVKENENKPLSEIYPEELRIKIINAFASINSNTRKGKRNYNEMFISNPKPPMAVFSYGMDYDSIIGNPVRFLNEKDINEFDRGTSPFSPYGRTYFLRKYALERDIPFVVFGN